jgi:predicted amidohydrolase YtcJ
VGSLEPGKLADLAVLKGDIFGVDKEEISKTKVLQTFVGGKPVYSASEA